VKSEEPRVKSSGMLFVEKLLFTTKKVLSFVCCDKCIAETMHSKTIHPFKSPTLMVASAGLSSFC